MAYGTVLQLELVVAVLVVVVEVVFAGIGTTKLVGFVAVADNCVVVEAVDNVVPIIVVVVVVAAVDHVAVADVADVATVADHCDGQCIEMVRVNFPMVVDVRDDTVVSLNYLLEADTATVAHCCSPKQDSLSCHPLCQLE
jgi:hypothetical protein